MSGIDMRDEIPAWVDFQVRANEDRAATLANGYYTTKDVEYALVTPPYSKDCVEKEVKDWLIELDDHVRNQRMPQKWRDAYIAKYEAWKKGLEIPEDGVPIKGWSMISPAQQSNLIAAGVRTVEALAKINDEGMKRYGMGAIDLKNKAAAYLKQAAHGKLAQENAALKADLTDARKTIEEMGKTVAELKRRMDAKEKVAA